MDKSLTYLTIQNGYQKVFCDSNREIKQSQTDIYNYWPQRLLHSAGNDCANYNKESERLCFFTTHVQQKT